jgi:hypothetical protein
MSTYGVSRIMILRKQKKRAILAVWWGTRKNVPPLHIIAKFASTRGDFMGNAEEQAIKQVIEQAYIQGIHGNQDEETVRSGFHQDFAI